MIVKEDRNMEASCPSRSGTFLLFPNILQIKGAIINICILTISQMNICMQKGSLTVNKQSIYHPILQFLSDLQSISAYFNSLFWCNAAQLYYFEFSRILVLSIQLLKSQLFPSGVGGEQSTAKSSVNIGVAGTLQVTRNTTRNEC